MCRVLISLLLRLDQWSGIYEIGVPFIYTRLHENQHITKQVFKQENLDKYEFFEGNINSFIQVFKHLKSIRVKKTSRKRSEIK